MILTVDKIDFLKSLVLAFLGAALFFIGLPFMEVLFQMRDEPDMTLRQVDTIQIKERIIEKPEENEKKFEAVRKTQVPKMILRNQSSAQKRKLPVVANMSFQLPKVSAGVGDIELGVDYSTVMGVGGLEKAVFEVGELDNVPIPLVRPSPVYPVRAKNRGIEGVVEIEFIVDKNGVVQNPLVTYAEPDGYFESAALNTIKRWKFIPGKIDKQPVMTRVRQKMNFKLGH